MKAFSRWLWEVGVRERDAEDREARSVCVAVRAASLRLCVLESVTGTLMLFWVVRLLNRSGDDSCYDVRLEQEKFTFS